MTLTGDWAMPQAAESRKGCGAAYQSGGHPCAEALSADASKTTGPNSARPGRCSVRPSAKCSPEGGPVQSSTRCGTWTEPPATSTCSPEGSPVSQSASSVGAAAKRTSVGSGPSSRESLASYDPATCSWRTSQGSLLEEGAWGESLESWPRSGMTRSGTAYRLPPSVPRTSAIESSLWPTPVAHDDGKTPEAHLAMKARMPGGPRHTITSLTVMVKAVERGMWPTPTANRWSGLQSHGQNALLGPLNPTWVEWLMGCPAGWTDSELSETASSFLSESGSDGESSNTRRVA